MKSIVYIGLDDTDVLGEPPGTGRVARELAQRLEDLGFGRSLGVTRHQLLVDPRIPYTSHNSSLCIGIETEAALAAFAIPCTEFIEKHAKDGADPGLCILPRHSLNQELTDFGWRATKEVLTMGAAAALANKNNIFLKELGGTGGGIIGALAGAALRASGNNGRFVELRGIREIDGAITAGDLKSCTGIEGVLDLDGNPLAPTELIESYGWIRPSMQQGTVVLRVQPIISKDGTNIWEPVENRKDKPKKKQEALK